jgi:peptidoglycan/xylan/chitin deacetylase (PgdA/CDA1 family)
MGSFVRSIRRVAKCGALIAVAALAVTPSAAQKADSTSAGLGGPLRDSLIISGAASRRIIHFTFDDGPDPVLTPVLLDRLDEAGVKATFFLSASRFDDRHRRNAGAAEVAREVLRRGHSVGSHSVIHRRMARLGRSAVIEQIDESERLFRKVFGKRTFLFRPPFGSRNRFVDAALAERGYTTVLWNLGLADWVSDSPEQLLSTFKKVLARREREHGERGGVVLLHDTHRWSVDGFALIHRYLMDTNCDLLARGEELFDVVDDLEPFAVPRGDAGPRDVAPAAPVDPERHERRQALIREETRKQCPSVFVADGPPAGSAAR